MEAFLAFLADLYRTFISQGKWGAIPSPGGEARLYCRPQQVYLAVPGRGMFLFQPLNKEL
jgi:hypothetical protein